MKKYLDIERCKTCYAETFVKGERIVIEEKIDFSNSSFRYDETTDSLVAFSRKQTLNEVNTLNGFWNWVQKLPVDKVKEIIGTRYIIFGEWAGNPHTVKYPDYVQKKFWMFDVFDVVTDQYIPIEQTLEIFNKLQLCGVENFVPIFYDGPFVSWDHIMTFVGKTMIEAEPVGEGIVIKRQDNLASKSSRNPFYVKIVSEKFSEVHQSKPKTIDPEKMAKREAEMERVATIVTPQRIEKMLFKLIDEQIIPFDWDEKNMKDINRILPKRIYEDCKKEENKIVLSCENFGKFCSTITMQYVRQLLNKRNFI